MHLFAIFNYVLAIDCFFSFDPAAPKVEVKDHSLVYNCTTVGALKYDFVCLCVQSSTNGQCHNLYSVAQACSVTLSTPPPSTAVPKPTTTTTATTTTTSTSTPSTVGPKTTTTTAATTTARAAKASPKTTPPSLSSPPPPQSSSPSPQSSSPSPATTQKPKQVQVRRAP